MTTTFETAKVGDKVWDIRIGWGTVRHIREMDNDYPVAVLFPKEGRLLYTVDGLFHKDDITQSLFWNEVKIEAPHKPLPDLEVDTKVLVWNNTSLHAQNAHFCCFEDGKIYTYENGRTSFTKLPGGVLEGWDYWELAE